MGQRKKEERKKKEGENRNREKTSAITRQKMRKKLQRINVKR